MSVTQMLFMQESGDTDPVSINDVNQGWLGDCFVCAPIAALALERPDYVRDMIHDNGNATYSVRLFITSYLANSYTAAHFSVGADSSTWITVRASDLGPGMNTNNGGQLIVNGVQEVWPQVIENAIAQVKGGYQSMTGGVPTETIQLLTGLVPKSSYFELARFGIDTHSTAAELRADLAARDIVTFYTGAPNGYGLIYNHVYTLTSITTDNGTDYAHFRNPWGYGDPTPIPVSDLSNAFYGMDVGTVPQIAPKSDSIDSTPPVVSGTENKSGLINVNSVLLSGTAYDQRAGILKVNIYDSVNGSTQTGVGEAKVNADGTWSFNATGLIDATHKFVATATDFAGNTSEQVSLGEVITVDTKPPQPVIKTIIGNVDGGIRLTGVSDANSSILVSQTVKGKTVILGSAVATSAGTWTLTSHSKVDTSSISSFAASATDQAGNSGNTLGSFLLASNGIDSLSGTSGISDVFAIMSFKGSDTIAGFESAKAAGAQHDYIDLSGRGISSFGQVQAIMSGSTSAILDLGHGKTVKLTDVSPASLSAADFRYS